MKSGGNTKCATYLASKGISATIPIKEKYESPVAQLYKEIVKARAEGRPEPTELPKPVPKPKSAPNSGGSMGNPGMDPNGMERLAGETEARYVARQTRLRNEAKARMAAKFGGGGMGGGGGRMGGVGSDSSYNPNGGYGLGASLDVTAVAGSLVSGFGTAFSTLGSVATVAASTASAVYHDPDTQRSVSNLAGNVKSTGSSFWGSLSSSVSTVTSSITQADDGDALGDLQRQMRSQQTGSSKYSGFGSDSLAPAGNRSVTTGSANGTDTVGGVGEDLNGLGRLTGESDSQYIARQTGIRDEAKARMAAKFGSGKPNLASASSGFGGGRTNNTSSPNSMNLSSTKQATTTPSTAPFTGNSAPDDFFASFGA